jgi:ribonuclease R
MRRRARREARRPKRAPGRAGKRERRESPRGERRTGRPTRAVVCAGPRGLELRAHPDAGAFRAALRGRADLAPGDVVRIRFEGRGRVRAEQRLGRVGDPELDFEALCELHELPREFPAACLRELDAEPAAEAGPGRLDLRALPFVTIDPARARDHDDAVFARREGDGFRLWVAIADVAHFVSAGSALDREARSRGNSVYLPERVVPMLPERLSGDLCSLRAGEERLALAVEIAVDAAGEPRRLAVAPARIESRATLAYEEAAALMAGGSHPDPALLESLRALDALARCLREGRLLRGSLDLELVEPEPRLGADGRVVAIARAPRTPAHRAIEEAMLAANRAIAELLVEARWPTLHRVHEPPDPGELAALEPVLASLGLWPSRRRRAPSVEDLPALAEAARGLPDPTPVHALLVRSMRQARYAEAPLGHFALGFDRYLHFTSPIRRYADLVVHRALKAHLAGRRPGRDQLADLAEHLSLRERAAARAEFQALDWKRAALLLPRIGEIFEGRLSTVAAPGLFVTLEAVSGDGLVPARALPRRARLDLRRAQLSLGRERLRLGDRVRVRLAGVDPARGRFRLALSAQSECARSAASARRSHSG